MRKDPKTGKRVSRVNPESSWQVTAVPHLRIIDADVFAAVQARLNERGHEWPATPRRPRHLLSGLLRCGCCGRCAVRRDGRATRSRDCLQQSCTWVRGRLTFTTGAKPFVMMPRTEACGANSPSLLAWQGVRPMATR